MYKYPCFFVPTLNLFFLKKLLEQNTIEKYQL